MCLIDERLKVAAELGDGSGVLSRSSLSDRPPEAKWCGEERQVCRDAHSEVAGCLNGLAIWKTIGVFALDMKRQVRTEAIGSGRVSPHALSCASELHASRR